MQGKGLTPSKVQYKVLDSTAKELHTSQEFIGLADCIDAINKPGSFSEQVSYYKAYRGMREHGVYAEVLPVFSEVVGAPASVHVVIISAVPGSEVLPGFAQAQTKPVVQPAPLFELGGATEDIASLADLARHINRNKPAAATKPVQQAKAAKPVVPLNKYTVEFYKFSEDGHRYELTTSACIRASSKKVARDVLREMLGGKRIQVLYVEPAPRNKRVDTKLSY